MCKPNQQYLAEQHLKVFVNVMVQKSHLIVLVKAPPEVTPTHFISDFIYNRVHKLKGTVGGFYLL